MIDYLGKKIELSLNDILCHLMMNFWLISNLELAQKNNYNNGFKLFIKFFYNYVHPIGIISILIIVRKSLFTEVNPAYVGSIIHIE